MYHTNMINEVLKPLPYRQLDKVVKKYQTDKHYKKFSSIQHLKTMIIAQMTNCQSLRDIEVLLSNQSNCLYHLHIPFIKRSTLSDANIKRDPNFFKEASSLLIQELKGKKQELHHLLTALDSSIIRPNKRGNSWAKGPRESSKGLKLHLQYDHTNDHIEYAEVTKGTVNDITVAQSLPIEKDRIYVFDKGYTDYNWWNSIKDQGSRFVSRLKKNANYKVLKTNPISPEDKGFIVKDQIISLGNKVPRGGKINELFSCQLRLIAIKHPDLNRQDPLLLVSNECTFPASTVAGWYKERWSVELIFKWLKQNLKLKKFIGESQNAVLIQIYTAIISYVLMKLYQAKAQFQNLRLKDLVTLIRNCLFIRPKTEMYHKRKREQIAQKQMSLFKYLPIGQAI